MNRMFRARIYAQAFTLVAVVAGGMYYKTERQQRREFERVVEARKNQQKRDAWLRELEIRDQEDKDWRERHAAMELAANEAGKARKPNNAIITPSSNSEADNTSKSDEAANASSEKKDGSIVNSVKSLVSGNKD